MTLENAEFIRSLCPDFRWLDRGLKRETKETYQAEIDRLGQKIENQRAVQKKWKTKITSWNARFLLEGMLELSNTQVEQMEKLLRKYKHFIGLLTNKKHDPATITSADIERAKEVPIETFYEGKLRRVAGRLLGLCPFHQERTPSFSIWTKENRWHCFGCGEGGDVIDYLMQINNISFLEAARLLK